MTDKGVVLEKVTMTFSDGRVQTLEGADARRWLEIFSSAMTGYTYPDMPSWQVTSKIECSTCGHGEWGDGHDCDQQ